MESRWMSQMKLDGPVDLDRCNYLLSPDEMAWFVAARLGAEELLAQTVKGGVVYGADPRAMADCNRLGKRYVAAIDRVLRRQGCS